MKKSALVLLIVLALSSFVPLLPVKAIGAWPSPTDFGSNFDNFAAGTVNPFPWTYTNGATSGSYGNVTNAASRSAPNSYQVYVPVTTSSPPPYFSAIFNATRPTANVTIYVSINGHPSSGTFKTCLKIASTAQTSSICEIPAAASTWYKISQVAAVTAGSTVTVSMNVSTSSASSPITWYFDDFSIIGAAAYTNSQGGPAYNFELYNSSSACGTSACWFDPSGYTGSTLTVCYTSPTCSGGSNVSTTWANAPTNGLSVAAAKLTNIGSASLISVWIGSVYERTLIPDGSNNLAMYIDNPSAVLAYSVSVIGPAGNSTANFPAGSDIFIQQGGHNITSGYLGSAQNFLAYLVPGVYTVVLVDGTSKNTQTVSFPDVTGSTVTVNVFGAPITYGSGIVTTQAFGVVWASTAYDSLSLTYQDTGGTTTQVGIVIDKTNSSGTYAVYKSYTTESPTKSPILFTIGMPVSSPNLSRNYSTQMSVTVYATSTFGTNQTIGTQGIPVALCSSCFFPSVNLPTDVLQLSTIFTFLTWQNLLALLLVVVTAGSFGFVSAKFGFLVLGAEIDLLVAMQWMPPSAIIASLPLFAVTAIMVAMGKGRQ